MNTSTIRATTGPERPDLRPADLDPPAARQPLWGPIAVLGAVALLGIGVRLRLLLVGRSLWLDEAMLALNICGRSFGGLLQPLDDDQGAPVGFLFLERTMVLLFGPSEVVLRLIPFSAGLASLALIYRLVVGAGVGRWSGVIGASLAATSPCLLYYSAELKQYSSDVAVGLGLLVLALPVLQSGWTRGRAWVLGLIGAAVVWLAHPAIFVLAGIGATLLLRAIVERRRKAALLTCLIGTAWVASFAIQYAWLLRDLGGNSFLVDYWKSGFLVVPPRSAGDLRNYSAVAFGLFEGLFQSHQVEVNLGPRMGGIFTLAWVIGGAAVLQLGAERDRRWWLALVVAPLAFAVLAAILGKYPLKGRLAIFTAASTLPVIAAGLGTLLARREAFGRTVGGLMLGLVLLLPTMQAVQLGIERLRLPDARGVLAALVRDYQPGDLVVDDKFSGPPFRFYQEYGRVPGLEAIHPITVAYSLCEPAELAADLRQRRGAGRVWFLLDTALPDPENRSREGLRVQLDEAGTPLASYSSRRYSAHLIQFGPATRDPALVPTSHP